MKNPRGLAPNASGARRAGFTIIELLIVVFIIGLLAAIVVVNLSNSQAKSRYAKVLADMETIGTAARLFENDNGRFPRDNWTSDDRTKYFSNWPVPPCNTFRPYDYEGRFDSGGRSTVWPGEGVTLTLRRSPDGQAQFWYPITGAFATGPGPNILEMTTKEINCP
ncbi:MAG: prepilin-type N-terminal cleavage/methylation domain-containing protein [Patescibacteria group bacterium]